MQRQFNKKIIMFLALWAVIGVPVGFGQANSAQCKALINDVRNVTNAPNLSYRYTMSIVTADNKIQPGKLTGVYYKSGKAFLDSNSYAISLLADGYFFKAEHSNKTAFLYRLSTVEKKTGIKEEDLNHLAFTLPDSLFASLGTCTIQDKGGNTELTYVLKDKNALFNEFHFLFRAKDHQLLEITMVSPLENGMKKLYKLQGFKHDPNNQQLNSHKYYSVTGEKATLLGSYHNYKMQAIL